MRSSAPISRRGLIATFVVAAILTACSAAAAGPTISGAWARPGAEGATTAAYLVITGGGTDDVLLSASSPAGHMTEIHETSMGTGGMMDMHRIDSLAVPAGSAVTLEPGGYHIMIMRLTEAIEVGDTIDLELVFERAGTVAVKAEVRAG
jgi:copper(I)-binding protein